MNALGAMVIMFVAAIVVSAVLMLLMFFIKDEQKQKVVFYITVVWGMVLAWADASGQPENATTPQLISWGFGAVAVIAILLQLLSKNDDKFAIAKLLSAISVIGGLLYFVLQ